MTNKDLLDFVQAIADAFPENAPRDRYGRYVMPRKTETLRELAVKYKLSHGGQDVMEQAGMVATAILKLAKGGGQ